MKTHTFHFLFLGILAASLSACGGGTLSDGQWTTTSSSAITLGFEDGASDVATDASFSITCPSALNASSVTATSFFLAPASSGSASLVDGMLGDLAFNAQVCLADSAVAGTRTLSNSDMTATLTPTERLTEGTPYALCGTADLRLANGSSVDAFTALFTTRDTTRPTVTATSPSYGAYAVPTNAPVKAKFSEGMEESTITTSSFTVSGASAVSGTIAYSAATKLATFSPSQDLSAGTEHTAKVTTGVTDDSGNALAENYAWTFTTASSGTTPSLAISTTGVLEVSVAGSGTPLAGSGIGLSGTGTPLSGSGSGSTPSGSGLSATSGLADIAFGGSSATNITNLTSQVTIDVADAGLSSCAVDSPFDAVTCSLAGFAVTRNQLSTGLGSSATANLSATGTTTAGGTIASNALAARKCTVSQISNIKSLGTDLSYTPYLTVFNNALYFSASQVTGFDKIYKYDGSTIMRISDLYSSGSDSPSYLTVFNNALYFSANNSAGYTKLFKYDGSTITQISNTRDSSTLNDAPQYLTVFNNALYFNASNPGGYSKVYKYDGSAITQISNTINSSTLNDAPQYLTVFNNALYFSANNSSGYNKLFKYDGVSTITQISNTRGSSYSDSPSNLTVFNNALYFSAYNSSVYTKLFKYDGTTITQISNSYTSGSDSPSYPTVFNGALYFGANNSWGVKKLFKYDGTTITQISNIRPDNVDDVPSYPMLATASALYFPAYNSVGQPKLFKYDGSNIVQVSDTCSGCSSGDGYYWDLKEHNNAVYFSADAAVAYKTKLFRIE